MVILIQCPQFLLFQFGYKISQGYREGKIYNYNTKYKNHTIMSGMPAYAYDNSMNVYSKKSSFSYVFSCCIGRAAVAGCAAAEVGAEGEARCSE